MNDEARGTDGDAILKRRMVAGLLVSISQGCSDLSFGLAVVEDVAPHSRVKRSRSALPMTETELKLIAAAATIGLSSRPKAG
jgi:hypothetical protein